MTDPRTAALAEALPSGYNDEETAAAILAALPADWCGHSESLVEALKIISDGRHPDGHRGAVLVARAALEEDR